MTFICEICKINPNSHSLKKIKESKELIYYYTCPSEATNNETEGIKNHFKGVLSELKEKKWIWILDMKNFGLKNFSAIHSSMEIARLITEKYVTNLQKISVINQNPYTEIIYNIIKPIFNERLRSIIDFSDNKLQIKIEQLLQEF
jgi:hypothetical protein